MTIGVQFGQCEDVVLRRSGETALKVMVLASPTSEVHCIGHNYMGHNDVGHNYVGHDYVGHNYTGRNYVGP